MTMKTDFIIKPEIPVVVTLRAVPSWAGENLRLFVFMED